MTLFFLGNLARYHSALDNVLRGVTDADIREEENAINDMVNTSNFVAKYPKVVAALRQGMSLNEAAKVGNVSRSTAQKVRVAINAPI